MFQEPKTEKSRKYGVCEWYAFDENMPNMMFHQLSVFKYRNGSSMRY